MKELVFDTGLVSFSLNGSCEVAFNPTDSAFVNRLFDAFDNLEKKQEAYKAEIEKAAGPAELFGVARKYDKEMREIIDGLFGSDVTGPVFGSMNVYALANGLPVWCNLLFAVLDEIDASLGKEQKLAEARIKKYTDKYHRK